MQPTTGRKKGLEFRPLLCSKAKCLTPDRAHLLLHELGALATPTVPVPQIYAAGSLICFQDVTFAGNSLLLALPHPTNFYLTFKAQMKFFLCLLPAATNRN